MLTELGSVVMQQVNPTENTMKKVKQFLNYVAANLDGVVSYRASGMVLAVHSYASYLFK